MAAQPKPTGKHPWPRILLVAYEFPPCGGPGVQRPAKTVKHWIRRGVEVAVLSASASGPLHDPSLTEGIPDEISVRVPDPSPVALVGRLRERVPRRGAWRALDRALVALSAAIRFVSVPDTRNGWLTTAVWRGLGLARRFRPDVIVATGPPFTSFLVAAIVSRVAGVPLVLDYRDQWAAQYIRADLPWLVRQLNPRLESWVLRHATGVVAAHRSVFEYLRKVGPGFPPGGPRRMWVPNGYDPDDFVSNPVRSEESFVLAYTGHFYPFRNPRVLFEVLEELLESGVIDPSRFRFRLAGDLKQVRSFSKPGPHLANVLRMEGYLHHPESVRCLQESGVNLLLEGTSGGRNLHSPGKVFEVLFAGRPVLMICPEGVTPRLARRAGGCFINDPADREGIRQSLRTLYEAWAAGRPLPVPDPARLQFYERGFQAERLLRFLSAVAPAGTETGNQQVLLDPGPLPGRR